MILDTLDNIEKYEAMHPDFPEVFKLLKSVDFRNQPVGKMLFPGKSYYINVDDAALKPKEMAFPEAHDQYIDIQMPIDTPEVMGYIPRTECVDVREAKPEKDITFFNNMPQTFFPLNPGSFVILFPSDGHAPIIGEGRTKKVIVKVKVA